MDKNHWLAERFDENRSRLRGVAYRILGSASEAEDAVQEAWLKISRSDTGEVANMGGWLTTIVARVCLDMLRSRASRREMPLAAAADAPSESNSEDDVVLADEIGPALLIVLEMLGPAERVAFVLHDLFSLSFEEIAPIVNRTPAATRQLASRARRRVRGVADAPAADIALEGWRPIATAPRGEPVLIAFDDCREVLRAWWTWSEQSWVDGRETPDGDPITYSPAFWMPLPDPPA